MYFNRYLQWKWLERLVNSDNLALYKFGILCEKFFLCLFFLLYLTVFDFCILHFVKKLTFTALYTDTKFCIHGYLFKVE